MRIVREVQSRERTYVTHLEIAKVEKEVLETVLKEV
jgi:hypothetical protein